MLLSSTSVDGWTLASTVCLCSLVKKVAGDHAAGAGALSLMQLLPMLWHRSQASLAASMMTGLRSHQRNWGIRCRLQPGHARAACWRAVAGAAGFAGAALPSHGGLAGSSSGYSKTGGDGKLGRTLRRGGAS